MIVQGMGNKSAKIWLIGEAPGVQEDKMGKPFVGGSGRILDGMLSEVGIKREDCYIDNVIQQRPKGNNFGIYYQDKAKRNPTPELAKAQARLQELVREYKPNVVAAFGNEAMSALLGKKGVLNWRGSILGCHGVKVIPILHPALIMRQYEHRPITVLDLRKVLEESKSNYFPNPEAEDKFTLGLPFEGIISKIEELHKQPYIAFDIETSQTQILCLGLGWSNHDSLCIPIFYGGSSWWTFEQEVAIIKKIKELFLNPNINFIAQNAQFDMIFLKDKWGVEVTNLWLDTMIAFHCLYSELRKGLGFLCSIYTKRPYYKGMLAGHGTPDELWKYNCLDTVVTYECAMAIQAELKEANLEDFYRNNSHKIIKPLMEMQRQGVKINVAKRASVDKNLSEELEALTLRLHKAVGRELNPNSPKQMTHFLYNELKLPPQRNKVSGNLSANADAITTLLQRFPNPVLNLILDIRKIKKLLSTYIRAPIDKDERIRCSYAITGTETGRLSSRASVYGSGTNLQNIPRGEIVRSLFIPDPGTYFINADLSQAEARVVAFLSQDERLQALFASEGDIHITNAARVFRKRIHEVSDKERQLAKTLVHAANYGIGPRTFSKHVGTTENEAANLLNQYYALYPRIKTWHLEVKDFLKTSRVMTTPMGRRRVFFGRWGPDLIREAMAFIPQATVSDLINLGIIRAWKNLPPEWKIMLQVHDSILMQVPIDSEPMHIHKFIKHYFENTIEIHNKKLKIPIEIKVGNDWAHLKKMEL